MEEHINSLTIRQKAINWWNNISIQEKAELSTKYYKEEGTTNLLPSEVEHIYHSERNEAIMSTFEPDDYSDGTLTDPNDLPYCNEY